MNSSSTKAMAFSMTVSRTISSRSFVLSRNAEQHRRGNDFITTMLEWRTALDSIRANDVPSNSKQLTSRIDDLSTKSWELQFEYYFFGSFQFRRSVIGEVASSMTVLTRKRASRETAYSCFRVLPPVMIRV